MLTSGALLVPEAPIALADRSTLWRGVVKDGGANVRAAPSTAADVLVELQPGDGVAIDTWVAGAEVYPTLITWGHVADRDGYVYGSAIRPRGLDGPPPLPSGMPGSGDRWIDVNLTFNVITAYEGAQARRWFPTSPGRPGWETSRGMHQVWNQVPASDMSGPGWYVQGVQWISYFLGDGEAIHARTWDLDAISLGVPSSHGCLGVSLDAAAFVYDFASPGTAVFVHD
jgi:L,D-transpeptidase catalytic domain